jgi:hypothetical protein
MLFLSSFASPFSSPAADVDDVVVSDDVPDIVVDFESLFSLTEGLMLKQIFKIPFFYLLIKIIFEMLGKMTH